MYTLASASIMAIRLAQHPRGAELADVVDRVLALSDDELSCLGTAGFSPYQRRRPDDLPDELLAVLEALARELPLVEASPAAADAALDAVAAAWLGEAALREQWDQVLSPIPVALPETAYAKDLRQLLEEVTRRQHWHGVARAHAEERGSLTWSTRMHEACLAAHEAGRLREIARAQLAAARALSLSTAAADPEFHAIAMEVTGSVQALCTGDLIDSSRLRRAWLAGT
jgi:hypothetical protein